MLLKPQAVDQSSNTYYSAASTLSLNPVHPSATVRDVLASLAPTDDPHHLGRIGPYEVTAVIGFGAMGVVLKVIDQIARSCGRGQGSSTASVDQ